MKKTRSTIYVIRKQSIFFVIPLTLLLALILAACGTNPGTGAATATTPTTTPTTIRTVAAYGCPGGIAANAPTTPANVVVLFKNSNSVVTAHNGDVIEFRLPFGQVWSGPTASQGVLQLQTPYGYASTTMKVCIWRFVAVNAGTTQLNFMGRAVCEKGQMCPQYILRVPFTIDVR